MFVVSQVSWVHVSWNFFNRTVFMLKIWYCFLHFFFMYSVPLEFSGYFVMKNKKEQEEFKHLKWVCFTVLVLGIVSCCVLAFINRVWTFHAWIGVVYVSLSSGELFVMNRHEPVTWKSIGATCALSVLLQTVFQINDFYYVTFKD